MPEIVEFVTGRMSFTLYTAANRKNLWQEIDPRREADILKASKMYTDRKLENPAVQHTPNKQCWCRRNEMTMKPQTQEKGNIHTFNECNTLQELSNNWLPDTKYYCSKVSNRPHYDRNTLFMSSR